MRVDEYAHGTFCWNELPAVDAARARTFYTSLFDWVAVDDAIPGGGAYTRLRSRTHERDVCALYAKRTEQEASMWRSFVSVDDVDASVALAAAAGARVISAPFDVMDAGRMAVIADPAGASLSLWQAKAHKGAGVRDESGSVVWNELATNDARGAASFYARVFGWIADVVVVRPPSSSPTTYTTFYAPAQVVGEGERRAQKIAGVIGMNEAWAGVPPHWSTYFGHDDVDGIARSARKLGGKVLVEPFDAAGVGRLTTLADPGGAVFSVIRSQ